MPMGNTLCIIEGMAMYRHTNTGPKSLKVTERPMYGSKRIGSYTGQKELAVAPTITNYPYTQPMLAPLKRYELTDHLGNVATVVTGRLLDGAGAGSPKQAEVVSAQGYEAFGSLLPGRNYSSDSYRFGFNGMEKDDELYGSPGTSYDFGARMYDSRVGRFLSIDPKTVEYSENSPYSYAANNPIYYVDKQGKNPVVFVEFVWEGGTALLALVGITAVGLIVKDAMFGAHTSWSTPLFASRYKDNPGFKDQQRRERMYGDFARIRDIAFAESVRRNLPNPGPDGSDPNGYEKISRTIGKVGAITLGLTEVLQNMRNIAIEEKGALEDNLADKQSYIKAKEGTSMAPGDQAKFNAIQALIPDIQDKIQARQDVIDFTDNLIKESQSKADYENPQISRQDNTRVGSGISGGQ